MLVTIAHHGYPGDSGECLNQRAPLPSHALTPTGFLVRSGTSAEESAMDGVSCAEDDAEALASAAELLVAEPRRERPTSRSPLLERRRTADGVRVMSGALRRMSFGPALS